MKGGEGLVFHPAKFDHIGRVSSWRMHRTLCVH